MVSRTAWLFILHNILLFNDFVLEISFSRDMNELSNLFPGLGQCTYWKENQGYCYIVNIPVDWGISYSYFLAVVGKITIRRTKCQFRLTTIKVWEMAKVAKYLAESRFTHNFWSEPSVVHGFWKRPDWFIEWKSPR